MDNKYSQQFKKGSLEMMLLCLIGRKETYGYEIITELNKRGMTILLVEQNAQMALSVAQRAYVLETGRIIMQGSAAELLNNDSVRKAYLGA